MRKAEFIEHVGAENICAHVTAALVRAHAIHDQAASGVLLSKHAENLSRRGCGWYQDRGRALCASSGNFRTRGVCDHAGAGTAAALSIALWNRRAACWRSRAWVEESIAAIGVSCGSPLDRVKGIVQAPPNLPTWVDVPICRLLGEAFHATCRLENDANAGAVAEHRFGAGMGTEHMVFLTLGTGLGAGIIAAGSLYLGANGDAGEIGHVRLSPTGPVGYHKAGSIEGWSSGGGIAQLAVRMLAQAEKRGRSSMLARADGYRVG